MLFRSLPHRKDLDAVEAGRPVFLYSYDGHSAWCNSAALKAAEITARTLQPPPGRGEVVKDRKTGEPTGALKEGAMALIENVLPKPSHEKKIAALEKGMRLANSFGITSVQNCSGGQDEIDLYAELQKDHLLTVRTSTAFPMPEEPSQLTDEMIRRIEAAKQAHHDHFVRAGTVKFFADGVIESNTAAMLAPYANNKATKGAPHYDARALEEMVKRVDAPDSRSTFTPSATPRCACRSTPWRRRRASAPACRGGTAWSTSRRSTPPTSRASAPWESWRACSRTTPIPRRTWKRSGR